MAEETQSVQVEETALPGIGLRHDFATQSGRRVGVVSHRTGRRDLVVYDETDPEACRESIPLNGEEADALANFLGAPRVVERLATLHEQVQALVTSQLRIASGSRYDGQTLGDTQARTRTGVSVVAVLRRRGAVPSPKPNYRLHGGDTLIVVGTAEGIAALADILAS
ncbi:MAG: cation:proton antiporter regulatory subunit [Streptosporangiaceae bacterium]